MRVTPKLGDKIRTTGRGGIPHYGIIVAVSPNEILVAHNSKMYGKVVIDTFLNFSWGQLVFREQSAPRGQERITVKRALEFLDKPYDFVNFNCDHFATYAQTGRVESPLLQKVVLGVGLASIYLLTTSESKYDRRVGRYRNGSGRFVRS